MIREFVDHKDVQQKQLPKERLTNGEAKATKHRVRFTANVKRFSLPYFYQPNPVSCDLTLIFNTVCTS